MISITPVRIDLGQGAFVQRALPMDAMEAIGPFVFFDHIGPVPHKTGDEIQVRAHPHIGLATITYLFSGELVHRDSLGNKQVIVPGEVNWMTAGSGIAHSERSQMPQKGSALEGIQIWVGLPKDKQEMAPSFQHYPADAVPTVRQDRATWHVVAGGMFGQTSPVKTVSRLFYAQGQLKEGYAACLPMDATDQWGLYLVRGQVQVEDQVVKANHLLTGQGESQLHLKSSTDAHVIFFGGPPFPEKRHKWWNFVSTSKDRIEQAKQDWRKGLFAKVVDEGEEIPLPE